MLELLSPAGSPEAVTAAVQSGADAVYLGYGDFNARRNAKNFSREELAAAVSYCHLRGAKVYLTLNTLVTDRELPAAAQVAADAARIGVDAVLIQDLGILRMLRQVAPDLPVHGSTQLTVHSLDGVLRCADLGMERVVLSRELSRDAIEYICTHSPIEIETFVHGALCMCYSGQCFLSSVIGGRSGNRGLCAQPCRLKYGWEGRADGYPLSLKDMSLAGHLQELKKLGVKCLKIEGRAKSAYYAAIVTGAYRHVLDDVAAGRPVDVRFIELMPIGEGRGLKGVSPDEALARLRAVWPDLHPTDERRGNGPAQYYAAAALEGRIGFIGAVSHAFCAACNRVRLTSTGVLKPCLCYEEGTDLRSLLRGGCTDEALARAMAGAIRGKPPAHCFAREEGVTERRAMFQIGG